MRNSHFLRSKSNFDRFGFFVKFFIGFVFVLVIAGFGANIVFATQTNTHTNCVVTGGDRVSYDGTSQSRIYTQNCGTFTADDSILDSQFQSADLYGQLREGGTYDFETRGVRLPIMSSFENIVKATPSQ